MKQASGGRSRGYTILETMIFLAVSAGMFISASALLSGRQARTEFTSAVRDFEASFNDVASDVSSGYYANTVAGGQRVECRATSSGPNLSPTNADLQGRNSGCIFIGKTLQFLPRNSNNETYNVISLVGIQFKDGLVSNGDVTNFEEAHITPLAPITGSVDATNMSRIGGGVTTECVLVAPTSVSLTANKPCTSATGVYKTDLVSFISTFQPQTITGGSGSGSSEVNIVVPNALSSSVGDRDLPTAAGTVKGFTTGVTGNTTTNPAGGVYVCLQSNGSDQYGLVKLGGQASRSNVATTIFSGKCK